VFRYSWNNVIDMSMGGHTQPHNSRSIYEAMEMSSGGASIHAGVKEGGADLQLAKKAFVEEGAYG
jgi:hypothetical protein